MSWKIKHQQGSHPLLLLYGHYSHVCACPTGVNLGVPFGMVAFWVVLFLMAGCATHIIEPKPAAAPSQTALVCDAAADEALQHEDYVTGLRLHLELVEKSPSNGLAWYHLGFTYGQIGARQEEISAYQIALKTGYDHNEDLFFNLGMALLEMDQAEEAIIAFKRALQLNPDQADHHFGLALAYQMHAQDVEAEASFHRAIAMDPQLMEARLHLSRLYADQGKFREARGQLKAILAIDPDDETARSFLEQLNQE